MKIYLITIKRWDYHQNYSFVVAAESEDDAIKLLKEKYSENPKEWKSSIDWRDGYQIREISPDEPRGEILGSFNEG